MYASLTLLRNCQITCRSYLPIVAVVVLGLALVSCGAEEGDGVEVAQVAATATSAPEPTATTAPPPTTTQAPTATIAPTATESPYWAKKILPGIAMEQYPPVNDRTDYELKNTQEWLNGEPTTIAEIRDSGRVVVVDFWTYT
ncbi:MAG: hypothetical protein OXC83_04680 [Chloroflexi bacterium]|nr:hypothetical protein [Chloroflexota bacterium]